MLAANPHLYSKLTYIAEKDFVPVGLLVRFRVLLVVNSQQPIKNYDEFQAWDKIQPNWCYSTMRPARASPTTWRPS